MINNYRNKSFLNFNTNLNFKDYINNDTKSFLFILNKTIIALEDFIADNYLFYFILTKVTS